MKKIFKRKLKKRSKQKIIALAFMGMGIVTILLMLFIFVNKTDAPAPEPVNKATQSPTETNSNDITILATGDWIAHDAINANAKTDSGYDYSSMTKLFRETFMNSDVNFCNLATMAGGEQFGVTGYPSFNAPLEWNRDMTSLGCNVINTGTNHTNDKGQAVINSTLDYLDSRDNVLAAAGANRSIEEQNKIRYFERDGVKFAFLSYSTYSNSPNPNSYSLNRFSDPLVTTQMTEARQNADLIIVSMRWGTEYSDSVDVLQKNTAQKLAELGADIILGHGTHTLQAVDNITSQNGHQAVVWYGLGNFLNAQLETGGLTGCVAKLKINITDKSIQSNECLPFYMHYEWSAHDKASENLLARSNFQIMPLRQAGEYLAKSQLDTTVEEQAKRIETTVNQLTEIKVL